MSDLLGSKAVIQRFSLMAAALADFHLIIDWVMVNHTHFYSQISTYPHPLNKFKLLFLYSLSHKKWDFGKAKTSKNLLYIASIWMTAFDPNTTFSVSLWMS